MIFHVNKLNKSRQFYFHISYFSSLSPRKKENKLDDTESIFIIIFFLVHIHLGLIFNSAHRDNSMLMGLLWLQKLTQCLCGTQCRTRISFMLSKHFTLAYSMLHPSHKELFFVAG